MLSVVILYGPGENNSLPLQLGTVGTGVSLWAAMTTTEEGSIIAHFTLLDPTIAH